jgi:hypothetical protein
MRVVLLNGPPRCGKDTIGEMLYCDLPSAVLCKFAQPIADYLRDVHGIDMRTVEKDEPHDALCGRTPREVAIAYSERMCKPLFGEAYFGDLLALEVESQAAQNDGLVAIVTDSGFRTEAQALARKVGPQNVLLVRVSRHGTDFAGDSRSYWPRVRGMREVKFANDGSDLGDLRLKVRRELLPLVASSSRRRHVAHDESW